MKRFLVTQDLWIRWCAQGLEIMLVAVDHHAVLVGHLCVVDVYLGVMTWDLWAAVLAVPRGITVKCPVLAGWIHAFFVPQMPPKGILSLSWVGFWPSKKWFHQVVLFFPFADWHHRCCPLRGGCISWWDEDDECSRAPHYLAFLTCKIVTHEGASVWLERSQNEKVDFFFGSTDWQTTGKPPVDLHFIVSPSPCALKLFRLGVGRHKRHKPSRSPNMLSSFLATRIVQRITRHLVARTKTTKKHGTSNTTAKCSRSLHLISWIFFC